MTAEQLDIFSAVRERDAVLSLIATDWRNRPHVRAIAEAIGDQFEVGQIVSANSLRPHLPPWVQRHTIGPTFGLLVRRGALQPVGFEPSTSRATHGKPVATYRVVAGSGDVCSAQPAGIQGSAGSAGQP